MVLASHGVRRFADDILHCPLVYGIQHLGIKDRVERKNHEFHFAYGWVEMVSHAEYGHQDALFPGQIQSQVLNPNQQLGIVLHECRYQVCPEHQFQRL